MPIRPGRVEIVEYDPFWPITFTELRYVLLSALGNLALSIEHVGSTSVPGLPAKPIIDIDVVIASRDRLPKVVETLAPLGYAHEGDRGIPGRDAFTRVDEHVPYTPTNRTWLDHHLYVCAQDANELARHLAFRDYLRAHRETRKEYAALKRRLAMQYQHDRASYADAKSTFVERILAKHQAETGPLTQ